MADFRRDKNLFKITITEDSLVKLDHIMEEIESRLLKQYATGYCYLSFLIRDDEKGVRLFLFDELLKEYKQADRIERILIRLDINTSLPVTMSGKEEIEIFITNQPGQNSYFAVSGSDQHWVSSTFTMLDEIFTKSKSRYSWVQGSWGPLVVQIFVSVFCLLWH